MTSCLEGCFLWCNTGRKEAGSVLSFLGKFIGHTQKLQKQLGYPHRIVNYAQIISQEKKVVEIVA
jgi:hypothetical protein